MSLIRWPWRRRQPERDAIAQARQALEKAKAYEARTRRVVTATERAIVGNNFARDLKKAMEGPR